MRPAITFLNIQLSNSRVKGVILVTSFTAFYKKIGINHADKISYILITII